MSCTSPSSVEAPGRSLQRSSSMSLCLPPKQNDLFVPPPLVRSNTTPHLFAAMSVATQQDRHQEFSVMARVMLEDSAWLDECHSKAKQNAKGSSRASVKLMDDEIYPCWHSRRNKDTEPSPGSVPDDTPMNTGNDTTAMEGLMLTEFMTEDGESSAATSTLALLQRAWFESSLGPSCPHTKGDTSKVQHPIDNFPVHAPFHTYFTPRHT